MGASSDEMRSSVVVLGGPAKLKRLFTAKNFLPAPGSFDSMAKPTKSRGGLPSLQFMASSAMPSPRYAVRVNGAAAFLPETWKSLLMGVASTALVVETTGAEAETRKSTLRGRHSRWVSKGSR